MIRISVAAAFLLSGCLPGDGAVFIYPDDDDDAVGDDDDAVGDDDDAVGDDDDVVGDDDDDLTPQTARVDCGPFAEPDRSRRGTAVSVISGAGMLDLFDNYAWDGCSVQRDFDEDGRLVCETLWDVTGVVYAWNSSSETAGYELLFEADTRESTCPVPQDQLRLQWYYRAEFEWGETSSTMTLSYNSPAGWVPLAVARLVDAGQRRVAFAYMTEPSALEGSSIP